MMKHIPTVAGALLGLLFVFAGLAYLLKFGPTPPPLPEGSPPALFMGALAPTGYLTFVKILEVLGGLLIAIPATRRMGLLILGPIIVNILVYHIFILAGEGLLDPTLIGLVVLALYLVWVERQAFAAFLCKCSKP